MKNPEKKKGCCCNEHCKNKKRNACRPARFLIEHAPGIESEEKQAIPKTDPEPLSIESKT